MPGTVLWSMLTMVGALVHPWAPLGTPLGTLAGHRVNCYRSRSARSRQTAHGAHFWNNRFRHQRSELAVRSALTPSYGFD